MKCKNERVRRGEREQKQGKRTQTTREAWFSALSAYIIITWDALTMMNPPFPTDLFFRNLSVNIVSLL